MRLTERMRADTRVMRDLATHTRIGPQQRVESAEQLIQRIHASKAASALLDSWDLEVEHELVRVKGRVLDSEKLIFADGRETPFDRLKAEWTKECRGKKPVVGRDLAEGQWALIFPKPPPQRRREVLQGHGVGGPPARRQGL